MSTKDIVIKSNELINLFRTGQEKLFKDFFNELFKEFPSVKTITWCQWTPGFNDGEPCEFIVGEVSVLPFTPEEILAMNIRNEEAEDYTTTYKYKYIKEEDIKLDEENFSYSESLTHNIEDVYAYAEQEGLVTEEIRKAQQLASEFIESVIDHLAAQFGNYGSEIIVTKEAIKTLEYDCGY